MRAILSEEGAVNLECKVIGVPQPVLKWYKDGSELKPGDIHRIISGQNGTCCLGTYTCEAKNCMGNVSSSASLLGFEDRVTTSAGIVDTPLPFAVLDNERELARNLSLSTIHEERTSQLHDTHQTDHSVTLDDRGEVSFSFDGKEVSVSLYETPDLTEEEAIQIVEMYADQLSEHVTEQNVIELPPMRFVKETSTSGNLLMEAVVIDVSPDYFVSIEEGDDLRTEADVEDVSILDDQANHTQSLSLSLPLDSRVEINLVEEDKPPVKPPRRKSSSAASRSERSEKSDKKLQESESFHSAQEPDNNELSSQIISKADNKFVELEKDVYIEKNGSSSLDAGDLSFDSAVSSGAIKKLNIKKKRSLVEKGNAEESTNEKRTKLRRSESMEYDMSMSIEKSQTDDESEKSLLMSNKEVLLSISRQLFESIIIIRDALVDFDLVQSLEKMSSEEQEEFILQKFVFPIKNLCNQLTAIESKALKSAEKRTLSQKARIAILEAISGPIEELLRGIEIMKRRENEDIQKTDTVILEPLVDPVDEILTGLAEIEYELFGNSRPEKPIVLERMMRTVSWLGYHIEGAEVTSVMMKPMKEIYKIVNPFINKITINPVSGTWAENIDAVLIESLCRPLEDLARTSTDILNNDTFMNPQIAKQLLEPFDELLTRLNSLVAALKNNDSDHRTKFVLSLKSSLSRAAQELARLIEVNVPSQESISLPEVILDPLIDVQSSINATLRFIEEPKTEEEVKISQVLLSSELVRSLAELRQVMSTVAQIATTLKEEETAIALTELREPLFDLQLALSSEHFFEELPIINSMISPLNAMRVIFSTTLEYAKGSEISNSIIPILRMLEEIQEQISMAIEELKLMKGNSPEICSQKKEPDRRKVLTEILETLDVANELSAVFFDLSSVLEQQERNFGKSTLSNSTFASILEEVRESIGSVTVALGNLPIKISLNDDDITKELAQLSAPLINLQKVINKGHDVLEQEILKGITKPMGKLRTIVAKIAKSIVRPERVILVLELLDDIEESLKILHNQICNSELVMETFDKLKSESLQLSENVIIERPIKNESFKLISGIVSSELPQVLNLSLMEENVKMKKIEDSNDHFNDECCLKKISFEKSETAVRTKNSEELKISCVKDTEKALEIDKKNVLELQEAYKRGVLISKEKAEISEALKVVQLLEKEDVIEFEDAEINEDPKENKYLQQLSKTVSITKMAEVTGPPDVVKTGKHQDSEKFETVEKIEIEKKKESDVYVQQYSKEKKEVRMGFINQPKVLTMAQIEETEKLDKALILENTDGSENVKGIERIKIAERIGIIETSTVIGINKHLLDLQKLSDNNDVEITEVEETHEPIDLAYIEKSEVPNVYTISETKDTLQILKATSEMEEIKKVNNQLKKPKEDRKVKAAHVSEKLNVIKLGKVEEVSLLEEVADLNKVSDTKSIVKNTEELNQNVDTAKLTKLRDVFQMATGQIENLEDSIVEFLEKNKNIEIIQSNQSAELIVEVDLMNTNVGLPEITSIEEDSTSEKPIHFKLAEAFGFSTTETSLEELKEATDKGAVNSHVLLEPMETYVVASEKPPELFKMAQTNEAMLFKKVAEEADMTNIIKSKVQVSEECVQVEAGKVMKKPKVLAFEEVKVMQEALESVEPSSVNISNIQEALKIAKCGESMEIGVVAIETEGMEINQQESHEFMETKDSELEEVVGVLSKLKKKKYIKETSFEKKSLKIAKVKKDSAKKVEIKEIQGIEEATKIVEVQELILKAGEKMKASEVKTPIDKVEKEQESKGEKIKVQREHQKITDIVEEFEQNAVTTPSSAVSELATAIEILRRAIIHVQSNALNYTIQITDPFTGSALPELSCDKEGLIENLMEMLNSLIKIGEALSMTQEYGAPKMLLLNRLIQPIQDIKQNVVNLVIESSSRELEDSASNSLKQVAQALKMIENEISLTLSDVNSRQQIMSVLHNVLRALEVVRKRMNDLDASEERTLETDVANILVGPTNYFSRILADLLKQFEVSQQPAEQIQNAVLNLHQLIEPLFEFHSSLAVVVSSSSRRSSVIETALLEERKNVILRSVGGLKTALTSIIETMEIEPRVNRKDLAETLLDSLITLNAAMISVQRHVW